MHSFEPEVGTERVGALDGDRWSTNGWGFAAGLRTEVEANLGTHLERVGTMPFRDANVTVDERVENANLRILAAGGTRYMPNGPDGTPFRLARVVAGCADDHLIIDLPLDASDHKKNARPREGRIAQPRPHRPIRCVTVQFKSAVDVEIAAFNATAVRTFGQLITHEEKLEHPHKVLRGRAGNNFATRLDVDADCTQADNCVGAVRDVEHPPHDERVQLHV